MKTASHIVFGIIVALCFVPSALGIVGLFWLIVKDRARVFIPNWPVEMDNAPKSFPAVLKQTFRAARVMTPQEAYDQLIINNIHNYHRPTSDPKELN